MNAWLHLIGRDEGRERPQKERDVRTT